MLALIGLFFFVALFYSSVGFGGGSSYTALLALFGTPYTLIPKISLICNLIVVSGGCWQFCKRGHYDSQLILPFVLTSTPMAFLGGLIQVTPFYFYLILSICLFLAGVKLLKDKESESELIIQPHMGIKLAVGAGLGLLAGLVGIGGGIFLSPLLMNLKWAHPKQAALAASFFIFLNSFAGLTGQFLKQTSLHLNWNHGALFVAVLLGGQIGSRLSAHPRMSMGFIKKATALLTLFVAARLGYNVAISTL